MKNEATVWGMLVLQKTYWRDILFCKSLNLLTQQVGLGKLDSVEGGRRAHFMDLNPVLVQY